MRLCLVRVALCLLMMTSHALAADAVDLGFEAGEVGKAPAGWRVPTAGWSAALIDVGAADGKTCVKLAKPGESPAPFGNLMQSLDAKPYQGRRVKLSAKVRVEGGGGTAQMWLRADRPDRQRGAFDNMGGRPIKPGGWTDAVIELDVDADAERLAIGFMALGGATVFVDGVKLEPGEKANVQEPSPPRALSERGLANVVAAARLLAYVRFFHPSDAAVGLASWDAFAVEVIDQAEPATDDADLAKRLGKAFASIAPTLEVWAGEPQAAPALAPVPEGATELVSWEHHGAGSIAKHNPSNVYASKVVREAMSARARADAYVVKSLGGGVSCRLPLKLFATRAGTLPPTSAKQPASDQSLPKLTARNRSTRLADVALCWGVMQHFYPYFDVVQTDWDAALATALKKAAEDATERAFLETLQELVAQLHDGHGNVMHPSLMPQTMLPVTFAWAGEELVIAGKHASAPGEVSVGDVVLSIDRTPTAACYEALGQRISAATDGWRRFAALGAFVFQLPTADRAIVKLRRGDGGVYEATLTRIAATRVDDVTRVRPPCGAELLPGIVYFNLDLADSAALAAAMPKLEGAKGIVFDVRGYPSSAAFDLLPHLIDRPIQSARWLIPIITRPDREQVGWHDPGRWLIAPNPPRLKAELAFVTDGRAISYAESILGIVEGYRLGEIVGATTAGTNGNVNPFQLAGGFTVSWTGMKVLKHDGSQHHGVGIKPTVPVTPTPAGIADGHDEVLARAVEVLKQRMEREQR